MTKLTIQINIKYSIIHEIYCRKMLFQLQSDIASFKINIKLLLRNADSQNISLY